MSLIINNLHSRRLLTVFWQVDRDGQSCLAAGHHSKWSFEPWHRATATRVDSDNTNWLAAWVLEDD